MLSNVVLVQALSSPRFSSQYSAPNLSIDLKWMHFSLMDLSWVMSWVIWKFLWQWSQKQVLNMYIYHLSLFSLLFLSAIYIYTVTIIENLFILAARICKKKKSPKLMRILPHLNMSTEFDHQKILDCMYCHSFSRDCSVIGQSVVSSIRR